MDRKTGVGKIRLEIFCFKLIFFRLGNRFLSPYLLSGPLFSDALLCFPLNHVPSFIPAVPP